MRRIRSVFLLASLALAVAAACGSTEGSNFDDGSKNNLDGGGTSGTSSGLSSGFTPDDGSTTDKDGNALTGPIAIDPVDPKLDFTIGAGSPPTQQFVAKVISSGAQVAASWSIDRGELGAIDVKTGVFTASGNFGGKATITAKFNGQEAHTTITINLKAFENGGTNAIPDAGADADAGNGTGGLGGVGGDGFGGAVSQSTIDTLHGAATKDDGLTALYPYDQTVWPRGILPPLLMWKPGATGKYDAVSIKLKETSYEFEGVYKTNNGDNFKNHPIPQQAWKALLASNGGEDVAVTLTFAKGDKAYGPINLTWKIAAAPLKGIVYYNSYGTKLAENYDGALTSDSAVKARFGGATLGVHVGSTDPVLVAGSNSDGKSGTGCRVCHSVAANGSVLITQRTTGEHRRFSTYDLRQPYGSGETPMSPEGEDQAGDDAREVKAPYAWSAIYPDGTMFLNDSSAGAGSTCPSTKENACITKLSGGGTTPAPGNTLWTVVAGDAGAQTPQKVDTTGWAAGLRAAYPAFSPDGKGLAFTMYEGAAGAGAVNQRTLGYMPFDPASKTWGAMTPLYTPPDVKHTALYPAFLPTNDAVIFEVETEYNGRDYGGTRARADTGSGDDSTHGAHGELWIVKMNADGTKTATRLDKLNGKGYIPLGATGSEHDDRDKEETLDYEPTVNPVVSGGYAWVVFTSRRLYGNVATQNPFFSDPRYHDLTKEPTTKKLWVAAIDLNAPAGTDPSHPAFYLPAQELLAGNSRGYWVVDPCKGDDSSCESGDECCGGYCRPNDSGALVCSNKVPSCAQEFEKCTTAADCCNSTSYSCINGRCAVPAPPGVK